MEISASVDIDDEECDHHQTVEWHGIVTCVDCGLQLDSPLSFEREWRTRGTEEHTRTIQTGRCHYRKNDDRSIFKDVENSGFPRKVVEIANDLYQKIAQRKIYRGASRKALIFACLFHSYKQVDKPQNPEKLALQFGLSRRGMSRGLKLFTIGIGKDYTINHTTPMDLVPTILQQLQGSQTQVHEIQQIYDKVKDCSTQLNRSNPQSTAAGLVYLYGRIRGKEFSRKDFATIVGLSEITISKVSREIAGIMGWRIRL